MVKKDEYVLNRVENLLDAFNDEEYTTYLAALKEAVVVQPSVRGRKVKVQGTDKRKAVAYVLPVYKNTNAELERLGAECRAHAISYAKTRDVKELKAMDMTLLEMDALTYYDVLVNEKLQTRIHKLNVKRAKLEASIATDRDSTRVVEMQQELAPIIERINTLEKKIRIDYFIDELPAETTLVNDNVPKARVKKSTTPPVVARILAGEFPFNKLPVKMVSKDECMTRSTKKPYYISLDDLRTAIDSDDQLKGIFGPGYKKMKKEQMCDIIFPPKKR